MDNDIEIAGDPLAAEHLMPPANEHPVSIGQFVSLANEIAAQRRHWAPLVRFDAVSRWYHRLRTGPGYEVWLLSWMPGQGSGWHDHGPSNGVFTVLDGALTERVAGRGAHVLAPGTLRVFAPGYVHEVVNVTLEPAVSLHVYFPGLTEMHPHQPANVTSDALAC